MKKQTPSRKFPWILGIAFFLIGLFIVFSYGVTVGIYHLFPYSILKNIRGIVFPRVTTPTPTPQTQIYRGDEELFKFAFTDPLIKGDQIYKPITSLDDIYQLNKSLLFPFENFFDAYDHLEVLNASMLELDQGSTKVLKINYKFSGLEFDAFAYIVDGLQTVRKAALIIPGSGLNESSAIYKNDPTNYHFGILEALGNSYDKFILIKPDEDCLAFHNGKGKLNKLFYVNWLLNSGGSYSANYIVGSLAITKYLQNNYDKVAVAGLSQGGVAALYNSLQSQPDTAIIASGYSVIRDKVDHSNQGQIIIPSLQKIYDLDVIKSRIKQSIHTQFLFTYGKADDGLYKIDAEEQLTCKYLTDLSNVECIVNNAGHIFPKEIIQDFISRYP